MPFMDNITDGVVLRVPSSLCFSFSYHSWCCLSPCMHSDHIFPGLVWYLLICALLLCQAACELRPAWWDAGAWHTSFVVALCPLDLFIHFIRMLYFSLKLSALVTYHLLSVGSHTCILCHPQESGSTYSFFLMYIRELFLSNIMCGLLSRALNLHLCDYQMHWTNK